MTKIKTFNELNLKDEILKAINDMGFEEPSPIQSESIPVGIEGYDLIGQAQTGTGKTAAFGSIILNNMSEKRRVPQALILAPTRELAIQVNEELVRIAKNMRLNILPIYGGQPIDRQLRALRNGVDIVVGTPGRVLDHLRRKSLNTEFVKFLVLDEADEMLNMGFIDDIEEVMKSLNEDRQTLLFSATMPDAIKRLSKRYMKSDAKLISIEKNTVTASTITQYYYEIKNSDRFESLCRIIDADEPEAAIIFCKTKKGVDELVSSMQRRGYVVEGMHGDMNQNQRMNTLKKFKESNLDFLVATDVAARGIDVENVTHVINYDLPQDAESYVHRIGRTGRANKEGKAYTLVTPREYIVLKQIEKTTKSKIKRNSVPTVDEIYDVKYKNVLNKVRDTIENEDLSKFIPYATELDDDYSLVDVAAALMKIAFSNELAYEYTTNALEVPEPMRNSSARGASRGQKRLFVSAGRRDNVSPKELVQFFKDSSRIQPRQIGDIAIMENFSFVNVDTSIVDDILKFSSGKRLKGRKINIEVAKERR
ncbi:DEAD/DEAH box helicase [Clostridium cellulovorans]|uniref:ATP-dependent RNA helicase CshA n=1 Tax=Clostridium cellulovorans (strain ATCC 35296 / DSM 3052 / OCM 3 / 743B) TaxID=573061 RepID=D9SVI0_CLOC7|nr:DEAD/DEAH box helicase [Clostridium cellulovorans]ADL51104.1 DEAD/DEAH box helicase domain protein [Clostridium cellulovorans 743B]